MVVVVRLLNPVQLMATPWTVAHQAPSRPLFSFLLMSVYLSALTACLEVLEPVHCFQQSQVGLAGALSNTQWPYFFIIGPGNRLLFLLLVAVNGVVDKI